MTTNRRAVGRVGARRALRAPGRSTLVLAAGVACLACVAPAPPRGAAAPAYLYVANALDGTVTRLDGASGRVVGRPLVAGTAPSEVAPGAGGRLLVLSTSLRQAVLTRVVPDGDGATARPVPLEPSARQALLAGDGGRRAVVAYHLPVAAAAGAPARLECRLAFVDLLSGAVERGRGVCGPEEQVTGVALTRDAAGTTVCLALWRPSPPPGAGRVVVLDAAGAVVAATAVAGAASHLTFAPAPGRVAQRLYFVTGGDDDAAAQPGAGTWRLRGVHPDTLEVESDLPLPDLPDPPSRVAFAPDGDTAYLVTATGPDVFALELRSGRTRRLAALPTAGVDLAVTADRLYASDANGHTVWAVDRRDGRRVQAIPVGRHPVRIVPGVLP
jgi:DNA-binding beta-propeller fold protein YncE